MGLREGRGPRRRGGAHHRPAHAEEPEGGVVRRSLSLARNAAAVAPDLVGCTLLRGGVGGVIVEVEAYEPADPASHSRNGPTRRNAAMFGPPGTAYVYRSYGMHWCVNIVCDPGSAVLVRALVPMHGLEAMAQRRGTALPRLLCSGPGRLCQALAITGADDGAPLDRAPFALLPREGEYEVAAGRRIGITKGAETPWRFAVPGSPFLSRPLRSPPPLSAEASIP